MSTILRRFAAIAPMIAICGAHSALAAGTPRSLETAIDAYERAQITGDGAALKRLLADDYLLITSGGDQENKQAFISDLVAPDFKLDPYVIQGQVRRLWANGAVIAGVARQRGMSGGKPFDACIRYADTWKLTSAGWQVVFTHVARGTPPTTSGCSDR